MLRPSHTLLLASSLCALALAVAGCQTKGIDWDKARDEAAFHPANLTAGGTRQPPKPSAKPTEADGYRMDAMIGQINGHPLYARQILQPMEKQLTRLGQTLPRNEFLRQAEGLIGQSLAGYIQHVQMLARAEGSFKEGMRQGINAFLDKHREELLRQYGQGSEALAQTNIFKEKGVTLEEEMKEYRESNLVGYYLDTKTKPLINVTRRDIERYYFDHKAEEFVRPASRTVRIIHTKDPLAATTVISRLSAGKTFAEVASDETLNSNKPSEGGLFSSPIFDGQKPAIGIPEVGAAAQSLTPAHPWDGPVRTASGDVWFVGLDKYAPGFSTSFDEAQIGIRAKLSEAQSAKLKQKEYDKAKEECSSSDVDKMGEFLMKIAEARYAKN